MPSAIENLPATLAAFGAIRDDERISARDIDHKESRMSFHRFVWMLSALLFAPHSAHAAKVKVWHQHTQSHYDKAKFKDAVVTSEGALRLSRQVKPLAGLEASNVWDLVED